MPPRGRRLCLILSAMRISLRRRAPRSSAPLLPWLVLLVALGLTALSAALVAASDRRADELRFQSLVTRSQDDIAARLETYISMLRGVSGLFAANPEIDRASFHAYVQRLDVEHSYPGVQGIGFSARMTASAKDTLVESVRRQGLPDFRIWPEHAREEYHAIVYLEPMDRRNRVAIGYDMFTDPARREAMERACDTGLPAASGKVTLVQEIDDAKQPGFLIYVPVYRGSDVAATLEERRARLIGYAYSPFRVEDLLRGIGRPQEQSTIAFDLYDGNEPVADRLLYQSDRADVPPGYRPSLTTTTSVVVAARPWTLVYTTRPEFDSGISYGGLAVLVAGIVISAVLFRITLAEVRARAEAEAAVATRDAFLSVASHELKTPLTALLGNAQLLRRRVERQDHLPDRDRRTIRVIGEQAVRLDRLITALLDQTRLQSGRFAIDREPLDLVALVRQVVAEAQPALAEHPIALEVPGEPLIVLGDHLRLEQVVQNLVSNAAKYSPYGGPIRIRLERQATWAVLRVIDQGIGIPESALPHLFEQFYRAPNAESSGIGGMGIGLYMLKEVVTRHGGDVSVVSGAGRGSEFTVRLTLAPDPATPPESP